MYEAKILADSCTLGGRDGVPVHRLVSLQLTLPRIVLAEFNTHRMLSRSSASSRAIPVEKQLARVLDDPFVPIYWGKNQKGMQAEEELTEDQQDAATAWWLDARDESVNAAERLAGLGQRGLGSPPPFAVHKQISNRLIEPFMWHTIIASATDWDNFFALRTHKDAQPEFRKAAEMVREVMGASTPRVLQPGEWHLPMAETNDVLALGYEQFGGTDPGAWPPEAWTLAAKISAGRCARVSYLTHDGKRDPAADIALAERLVTSGHMAPLEHPARAFTVGEREAAVEAHGMFMRLIKEARLPLNDDSAFLDALRAVGTSETTRVEVELKAARRQRLASDEDAIRMWQELADRVWYCGNYAGFRQLRKMIPGEAVFTGGHG